MNKREIAELLVLMSGFDRFQVTDPVVVEAWAMIPAIQQAPVEAARTAVLAHFTGSPKPLLVADLVAALTSAGRQGREDIAADVRSARARGLIDRSWPEAQPVPDEVRARLTEIRNAERDIAMKHPPAVGHWDGGQDYGDEVKRA